MEVVIHGNISVYEPDGVYQLYVTEMEPAGMGSLYLAFEQLKKRLEEEGLFRNDLKKELPLKPERIAIITSPGGAALQDILVTIKTRFPHVKLHVVESLVQGAGAAADLKKAINLVNERNDADLIILARGGGSLEDLWPFNEEVVARAVFSSRLPVISAVGHETDYTITDFVADLRAATPTAAAQAAVPDLAELITTMNRLDERIVNALQSRLQREKQLLDQVISDRVFTLPGRRLKEAEDQLNSLETQLKREAKNYYRMKAMELSSLIEKLDGYSPLKIMSRGYSFCRGDGGAIIRSVKEINPGDILQLSFRDGKARCRAEELEEENIIEK
jgi:exodeoxyribonuclease VII large subunit